MTLDGTNSWVLRAPGHRECVVVDPGPADEGHLGRLAAADPVALTLVTHGHPDHVEGLPRYRELAGGQVRAVDPAYGHPLRDGELIEAAGLRIEVLATPGHTADSACFLVRPAAATGTAAVLTGDTVLGRGTTVVMWPDGDLGDYLASLERLAGQAGVPVLPGHGPALADCAAAASYYLAHRRARLDQVRAALAAGAGTPMEIVRRVYADVDPAVWPAAELTVRAQLGYLETMDAGQRGDTESKESPLAGPATHDPSSGRKIFSSDREHNHHSRSLDRP